MGSVTLVECLVSDVDRGVGVGSLRRVTAVFHV